MVSRRRKITKRKITKRKKSRKYKQRNSNQRNKINKRIIGGRYVAAGQEGVLYTNPRPPCVGERHGQIVYSEIGKIFPDNYASSAHAEMYASRILEEISENPSQYFVMPIKECKINKELINNKEVPYTVEWRQNKDGMFNNRILRNAEENLSEDWNTMVVYPLGQMDLFDILSSTYEVISFVDVLNKFTNVLEGVKLLQDNNLFYGDFSLENILLIDGVLKIADIGNIQEIYHGTDMKSIPYFYYSYIYIHLLLHYHTGFYHMIL